MFVHIFTYRLKCLMRDWETILWTMVFPLVLATLFYMAFSNLYTNEIFNPINIAVVNDEQYVKNKSFRAALEEVSTGDGKLFNLSETTVDEADKLLNENLIDGYIVVEMPIKLVVNNSGVNQSIIKSFIDTYMHASSAVETILTTEPMESARIQKIIDDIGNREKYVSEKKSAGGEPNTILLYFYTLIAMTCFYGGFFGMREINDIQADISNVAARVNAAPVHKIKAFLSSAAASVLIQTAEILILISYLMFVLKIDFGNKTGFVLLTAFIGVNLGFSFGAFISAVVKKSEGVKVAAIVGVTMICCFFAGMMQHEIKYIVSQKAPIFSYINPLNLLTDSLYSLYYYDTFSRYFKNIILLTVFIAVFCSGTYLIIRRRKYASI
jgi:ABC-2 type transport system permease protein